MPIVKTKPTSPGRRFLVKVVNPDLHKGRPCDSLVISNPKSDGRNCFGRITQWQRGGGHKRLYRIIDWKRDKHGVPGKVERLEYDPNRSANIALVLYADGERRYMIAPEGLKKDDKVISAQDAPISVGNSLPLRNIPLGTVIHCVEMKPGKGSQIARSAGSSANLLGRESSEYVLIRLESGEVRKILADCRATIGRVGNSEHNLRKIGKAGANRWRGKRPRVRGVAMNPVDHPLGGGEGRTSGGRPPCTPWGIPEGTITRRNKRTNNMIIRSRRAKK